MILFVTIFDLNHECTSRKNRISKKIARKEDIRIIAAIKSIFLGSKNSTDEWGNLPDLVIEDIK